MGVIACVDNERELSDIDGDEVMEYSPSKHKIRAPTNDIIKMFENSILMGNYIKCKEIIQYSHILSSKFFDFIFTNGDTCLCYAVRDNEFDFVLFLLKHGCNPNVGNELTLETPLHIAAKELNEQMIDILIQFNADIHAINILMETPKDIIHKNKGVNLDKIISKRIKNNSCIKSPSNDHFRFPINSSHQYNDSFMVPIEYLSSDYLETPTPMTPMPKEYIIYKDKDLCGWLFKLNTAIEPNKYDKKYVFIKDGFLIWDETFINIDYNKRLTVNQIKGYDGVLSLELIKDIQKHHRIDTTNDDIIHEFEIIVKPFNEQTSEMKLMFKCVTSYELDKWFLGIHQHCQL